MQSLVGFGILFVFRLPLKDIRIIGINILHIQDEHECREGSARETIKTKAWLQVGFFGSP